MYLINYIGAHWFRSEICALKIRDLQLAQDIVRTKREIQYIHKTSSCEHKLL